MPRLLLSRAKHPSLAGHTRIARWLAKQMPFYEFTGDAFFAADGAPADVAARRQRGFARLANDLERRAPETVRITEALAESVSDLQFTTAYRVPFQFRTYISQKFAPACVVQSTDGVRVSDLDGNISFDVAGSYGMNVFGFEFYKTCVDAGIARVRDLGPVLGVYHPVVVENVERLKLISGMDEVSFHMSGTEAVMQAVRLARYHTGRTHLVRFCGAYHGWWDDVQPGVGTPGSVRDVYTLRDIDERTLRVLATRSDIACVLVNPLQALHPNAPAAVDGSLVTSDRRASFDADAYARWLRALRRVCSERAIPLIFDEVFVGFRIAYGGAQQYFGVAADLVTYGKTVGGGLPIGVLCGKRALMKRFRDDRPSDICFARGTFNSHPYVMGAMNEFLRRIDEPVAQRTYAEADGRWNARAAALNARLEREELPLRVANLTSIFTVLYLTPSRYNWMFQFYLRAAGLMLPWVGTGRLIFSHDYTDADFAAFADRFTAAARAMDADQWWWRLPETTNAVLRREILREALAVRFRRSGSDRRFPRAGDESGTFGTARRHETGR
jgi:glutamate-1-semialdehyde 2,1-aminomutase